METKNFFNYAENLVVARDLFYDAEKDLLDAKYPYGEHYKTLPAYQLFDKLINFVCEDLTNCARLTRTDAKSITDNFYINGGFTQRNKEITPDDEWKSYCDHHGIISNENVCCYNLGF